MRRHVFSAIAALLCGPSGLSAQASLPTLRRLSVPGIDSIGPEKAGAAIAVSSTGMVAYTGAFDAGNRLLTIVDSTGRMRARFGTRGQGPGELGAALQIAFTRTELVTIDLSSRRMSRFGFDGAFRGSAVMPAPMMLAGTTSDSIDMLQWPDGKAARPLLDFVRVSPVSATGRLVFSGQSPLLQELSQEGLQKGATLASVLYIADGGAVVAVNVGSYRMLGIESDGRVSFDIKGARVSTPPGETPLYLTNGVHRDGMQRVWALGTDVATGRTFADLYLKGRHLGRIDLPCKGVATVAGAFVAVLCAEPKGADRDVSLRMYRIEERR